jgi:ribosome recycling factor
MQKTASDRFRTHHTCLDQQFASFQFRRQKLNILDGIAIDNS